MNSWPVLSPEDRTTTSVARLLTVLCAFMVAWLVLFVAATLHWPLVGDAVSAHYLILLMQHGMAPYRQIVDAQMPGTYFYDWAVLRVFGGSALGLRLFDFSLSAAAIAAMVALAWPKHGIARARFFGDNRPAAFLAGGLFALVHGQDGIPQTAQRDLVMAVLLLIACACSFHALRAGRSWLLGMAAACGVFAATIKPTVLPVIFVLLLAAMVELRHRHQLRAKHWSLLIAGTLVPLAMVAAFLGHFHAVGAFVEALRGLFPYHASLFRHPPGYLLTHALAPVPVLVVLWICTWCLERASGSREVFKNWETRALYAALLLALLSYVLQGKAFPYQRYPFLAFLLYITLTEASQALRLHGEPEGRGDRSSWPARTAWLTGALALALATLVIAPISLYKLSHFDWRYDEDFQLMRADLDALGGPALSGHVQCLDAFGGCVNTLYRMNLQQSSGFLVDFYLFSPRPAQAVDAMRRQYWEQLQHNPPRVFVITKDTFPRGAFGPDAYERLASWPAFQTYLDQHYRLLTERTPAHDVFWSTRAERPAPYRIYVRRP